jgi:dolichyl-phosphate-mannose-protein mannosyltransferase
VTSRATAAATGSPTVVLDRPDPAGSPSGAAPPVGRSRWGRLGAALRREWPLLVIAGASSGLNLFRLGEPDRIYFDEYFYAKQAGQYILEGVEFRGAVHPPLGKWLIAGGIELWGYTPFGWRFASAVAGTLTVVIVYVIGRLLFERRSIAALAAVLLAVDGVFFTMSRIAMLDIFVAPFVALGFLFIVVDKRAADRAGPRSYRWWWAAGAAFGLAASVKWSALAALFAAVVFVTVVELARRRRGEQLPWARAALTGVAAFAVLPAMIYMASFTSWFVNFENTRPGRYLCNVEDDCDPSLTERVSWWWRDQRNDAEFHAGLRTKHPYADKAWKWPLLASPVRYGRATCPSELVESLGQCITDHGNVRLWLGQGNPAIWWAAIPATGLLAFLGIRRRDWRALALVGFVLVQWLPWVVSLRKTYLFYATPIVPFLCLLVAFAVGWLSQRWQKRWIPTVAAMVAVATFAYYYPIYTGLELPSDAVEQRILFDSWH